MGLFKKVFKKAKKFAKKTTRKAFNVVKKVSRKSAKPIAAAAAIKYGLPYLASTLGGSGSASSGSGLFSKIGSLGSSALNLIKKGAGAFGLPTSLDQLGGYLS